MAQFIATFIKFSEQLPAFQRAAARISSGAPPVDPTVLQKQLHQIKDMQAELFLRRFTDFGKSVKNLPKEFEALKAQLGDFKQLSVREALKGSAVVGRLFGFFCIGEVIGRRNMIGYATPKSNH